jgi:glycosyltransferase involved in cell wall biosynthesis
VAPSDSDHNKKRIRILGIRGLPASYGGFETFAQDLALYLVSRGWDVFVYCQDDGGNKYYEETWKGIRLFHVPGKIRGARGSVLFDWKCTLHATRGRDLVLSLGYNTAVYFAWLRLRGVYNVVNIGGVDWKRRKWSLPVRWWFYINFRIACALGNHLVADHPGMLDIIARHASRARITTIPYGADPVESADAALLEPFGVRPREFVLVIARSEPGHSLVDIVSAWSRKPRGMPMLVVGPYTPKTHAFHRKVMGAAGDEVRFTGAIFDRTTVRALRYYARLYVHGHHHGGTNPGLVEALGARSAVLANDNIFNRWVAGDRNHYFRDADECSAQFDRLLRDETELEAMREASLARFRSAFRQELILAAYERMFLRILGLPEPPGLPAAAW